jgi:hypothetical protein
MKTDENMVQVWLTDTYRIVLVRIADMSGLYYYQYTDNEYLMLEKSPQEYELEYLGEL